MDILKFIGAAVFCTALLACKNESCTDGEKNQNETGIDCGGDCQPCATCSDGIKNQGEAGIDCGGPCDQCPVYFPESGTYGTNILNNDSLHFSPGDYSMRAEVPEGSTFKAILYSVDGGPWFYSVGTNTNIIISEMEGGTQTFEAAGPGIMQVQMHFQPGSYGTCYIQYFENSSTETKGKTITWS